MGISGSLIWMAVVATTAECHHDERAFRCVKFSRNYDGDTITVSIPNVPPLLGQNMPVRLKGIDTAEITTKNECEKKAGRITKNLVENLLKRAKRIDLVDVERDKYFRILADVQVDGKSVSQILLKNRLAVAYQGGTKSKVNWCEVAQREGHELN